MTTISEIASGFTEEAQFDAAIEALTLAKFAHRRRLHAEALAKDTSPRDVHTEHCCVRRGCKYGYDVEEERDVLNGLNKHCTVTSGEKIQSYCYEDDRY
jgi:hypothetical protein